MSTPASDLKASRIFPVLFGAGSVLAIVILVAALSHSSVIAEQYFRSHAPAFSSQWNLTVGSGAEYDAQCSYGVECIADLSIVGQENFKGHEAYWMEIVTRHPDSSEQFINKALFYLDGENIVFPSAITQVPGHPAMMVPHDWIFTWARGELALASGYIEPYRWGLYSMERSSYLDSTDDCAIENSSYEECYFEALQQMPNGLPGVSRIGTESLTTSAGTFNAEHWRFHAVSERWRLDPSPIDVWTAKGAGPFGIVRVRMHDVAVRDNPTKLSFMTLSHVFSDVQDKISGAPRPADAPQLWQWLWDGRRTLLTWCVPSLGLPECCDYTSAKTKGQGSGN